MLKPLLALLIAAALLSSSAWSSDVSGNNGGPSVDVVMDVPEPEEHINLPFQLKGSCSGGRLLSLQLSGTSALPQEIKLILTGELDLLHHVQTANHKLHGEFGTTTSMTMELELPDWSILPDNYVSVFVISAEDKQLLARWEFVKMAEVCGLVAMRTAPSSSPSSSSSPDDFDGNLPSHKPSKSPADI
jgi:hypothetical protein